MKEAILVIHGIHNQMLIIGQCINTMIDALESCIIGIKLLAMLDSIRSSMLIISSKSKEGEIAGYEGGGASEVEGISSIWVGGGERCMEISLV